MAMKEPKTWEDFDRLVDKLWYDDDETTSRALFFLAEKIKDILSKLDRPHTD